MHKNFKVIFSVVLALTVFFSPGIAQARPDMRIPDYSSASELINAVNALRAANGLAPYQTNSILMSVAQTQADYLASISGISHLDAQGRPPYQRALAAGYQVAGDITNNIGLFSENVTAGIGQTAEDAVRVWMGDDPHKNTMLSGILQDVGAGVGLSGDTYYYVLDAGLSTGSKQVAYTPPAPLRASKPTIIPSTPTRTVRFFILSSPEIHLGRSTWHTMFHWLTS